MGEGLIAFLVIIGFAVAIALVAFIIYKVLNPKLKTEERSEEEKVAERLDEILQPIEDEEIAKEVSSYKEKDD